MKKNSTLSKKLKSYSALAGTVTAVVASANAQVVYTDVAPDVTVNGNQSAYALDLDNDGNADFLFVTVDTTISSVGVKRVAALPYQSGNAMAATTSAGPNATYIYPLALAAGQTVDANMSWNSGSVQSMASQFVFSTGTGSFGNWIGATDKYLPLRFIMGGANHYGWARFDVASTSDQFTIKDYAYDGTAETAVVTGAQSAGISNIHAIDLAIYSFENTINLAFATHEAANGIVTVTNVLGQEIKNVTINSQIMHIDMSDVVAGTYFVVVKQNNGIVATKKVSIN